MAKRQDLLSKILKIVYTMGLIIVLSAIVGLILAFPVMWLWNFVFGNLYEIDVFQAWAMNVLASILFSHGSGNGKK